MLLMLQWLDNTVSEDANKPLNALAPHARVTTKNRYPKGRPSAIPKSKPTNKKKKHYHKLRFFPSNTKFNATATNSAPHKTLGPSLS